MSLQVGLRSFPLGISLMPQTPYEFTLRFDAGKYIHELSLQHIALLVVAVPARGNQVDLTLIASARYGVAMIQGCHTPSTLTSAV